MKNRKVAALLLSMGLIFTAATGCEAQKEKQEGKVADTEMEIGGNLQEDSKTDSEVEEEKNSGQQEDNTKDFEGDSQQADETQDLESLMGHVKSVGQDSLVVSKAFEEEENVLVSPVEGSEDETLITVIVSENTQYELKVVRNGGVNGAADVEVRSVSITELEEGMSVDILGYQEEGKFTAAKICMYQYV